jgi:hypothetical protein
MDQQLTLKQLHGLPIYELAKLIREDLKDKNIVIPNIDKYMVQMSVLKRMSDYFDLERATIVTFRFLAHSEKWNTKNAELIKYEIRRQQQEFFTSYDKQLINGRN